MPSKEQCACFPGSCRGGQVVNGETLSGYRCKAADEPKPPKVERIAINCGHVVAIERQGRSLSQVVKVDGQEWRGVYLGASGAIAMFDRIVELEATLAEIRKHVRFGGFRYLLDVASDERNTIRIEHHVRREWLLWASKAQALLSEEIPVPCSLRPSRDEQTDDTSGIVGSHEC